MPGDKYGDKLGKAREAELHPSVEYYLVALLITLAMQICVYGKDSTNANA